MLRRIINILYPPRNGDPELDDTTVRVFGLVFLPLGALFVGLLVADAIWHFLPA